MLQNLVVMLFFMLTICMYYALKVSDYALKFANYAQGNFFGSLECTREMCTVSLFNALTKLLNSLEVHGPCYIILATCF